MSLQTSQNPSPKIKIAIAGLGNLGQAAITRVNEQEDMQLVYLFSRRELELGGLKTKPLESASEYAKDIDVLILCAGSATDLPELSVRLAKSFNLIDSFDNHAKIPEHFLAVKNSAKSGQKLALISAGWDPGLFSMLRALGLAILPHGKSYTFWGPGLSQGHSDALRRVRGVKLAAQYTLPNEELLAQIASGKLLEIDPYKAHKRSCFIVLEKGANAQEIEKEIVNMPNYFAPYKSSVTFIDEEEFFAKHSTLPHAGCVWRLEQNQAENSAKIGFSLQLPSNPSFTAAVLVACARAVFRLHKKGQVGALSMLDIPISALCREEDLFSLI